jgi:hypothetical protein
MFSPRYRLTGFWRLLLPCSAVCGTVSRLEVTQSDLAIQSCFMLAVLMTRMQLSVVVTATQMPPVAELSAESQLLQMCDSGAPSLGKKDLLLMLAPDQTTSTTSS